MNRSLTISRTLLALALGLAGCSQGSSVDDELAAIDRENAIATGMGDDLPALDPGTQPVRIGEGGDGFAACQASGLIAQRGTETPLPVFAAPFQNAKQVDRLVNGDAVYVCNRSHDQKWLGVVYAEDRAPRAACGVTAPASERRDYAGPCRSGWVSSAAVRLVAG